MTTCQMPPFQFSQPTLLQSELPYCNSHLNTGQISWQPHYNYSTAIELFIKAIQLAIVQLLRLQKLKREKLIIFFQLEEVTT